VPEPTKLPPTPHEAGDTNSPAWLNVCTMPSTTLVGVNTLCIAHAPPVVFSHPPPFHVKVPVLPFAVSVASHMAQSDAKWMTAVAVAVRNVDVIE
jgi:hypothetical protein